MSDEVYEKVISKIFDNLIQDSAELKRISFKQDIEGLIKVANRIFRRSAEITYWMHLSDENIRRFNQFKHLQGIDIPETGDSGGDSVPEGDKSCECIEGTCCDPRDDSSS